MSCADEETACIRDHVLTYRICQDIDLCDESRISGIKHIMLYSTTYQWKNIEDAERKREKIQ